MIRNLTITAMIILFAGLSGGCSLGVLLGAGGGYLYEKDGRAVDTIVTDSTITSKIKNALIWDSEIDAWAINVDTYNYVVTLNGKVPNNRVAQKAIKIARDTKNVRDVTSKLIVEQQVGFDNSRLNASQQPQFARDDFGTQGNGNDRLAAVMQNRNGFAPVAPIEMRSAERVVIPQTPVAPISIEPEYQADQRAVRNPQQGNFAPVMFETGTAGNNNQFAVGRPAGNATAITYTAPTITVEANPPADLPPTLPEISHQQPAISSQATTARRKPVENW